MSEAATPKTHKFEAEVSQVLSLVINSLYSNKEVFLRELISNAADALDKLRFESIQNPGLLPAGYQAKIRLIPDEKNKTLTLWDNGVGMTEAALAKDLGTVDIQACSLSMDLLHLESTDLDPLVDGVEGVTAFYLNAGEGQIVFI